MPLQNRVNPWDEIIATAERGTMLGNRGGKFHRDDRTLGKRRWASHHWIACDLHYKNMHHDAMGQGYTSLFFLDEVTALAAGHRPCFFCRRKEAKAFLGNRKVDEFDRILHGERLGTPNVRGVGDLPDGTIVDHGGDAFAVRSNHLLRWSFAGYVDAMPIDLAMRANVLTPPSIIAILHNGYQPRWHETALNWGET